jgi:hypothetical protein
MKKVFFILSIILLNLNSNAEAQIKGVIVDKKTKLPIAFASVIYGQLPQQKAVISDSHGKFEIKDKNTPIVNIIVSCIGYLPTKINGVTSVESGKLYVELEATNADLTELTVTPENNPAIRIVKAALQNKTINNHLNYDKYSYNCYFKTNIDIKLSENANHQDSLEIAKNKQFQGKTPFVSECIIHCIKSGSKTENKIIAHKTAGINDPLLVQTFATLFHNSISFYENNVSLFGLPDRDDNLQTKYISPLASNCLKLYNYDLEETVTAETGDSIFIISFGPKKNSAFNGLRGKMYISSNQYAIKNMVVEPADKGLLGFKFRQDFEFSRNKWFPVRLDEEVGWIKQKVNNKLNAHPVYLITSIISNVSYEPDIPEKFSGLERVSVALADRKQTNDSLINNMRYEPLSLREINGYHYLDSIGKVKHFDLWTKKLPDMLSGMLPVSFVDLKYPKLIGYNKYEGWRPELNMTTNKLLSTCFSVNGFVAYGLKDKEIKYGGELSYHIKEKDVFVRLLYKNDLTETGVDQDEDYRSFNHFLRHYIGYRFDHCTEEKIESGFRLTRYLKVRAGVSIRELTPEYAYTYKGSALNNFRADEISLQLRYGYKQEVSTFGNYRGTSYEGNPVISVTYKKGINLFSAQSFRYNKFESFVDFTAYKGTIGQSKFRLAGGYIDRSVPYGLLFSGEGSKNKDVSVTVNNSFQTMDPYEFLSDRYLHLFFSHNFGTLLSGGKKFKPEFIVVQNTGWGMLSNAEDQGIDFQQKDKTYLESGLIINNIIKINYMNFFYIGAGAGIYYRYGYYAKDKARDNLTLKLSLTLNFK